MQAEMPSRIWMLECDCVVVACAARKPTRQAMGFWLLIRQLMGLVEWSSVSTSDSIGQWRNSVSKMPVMYSILAGVGVDIYSGASARLHMQ
jgi:hypothetical protein